MTDSYGLPRAHPVLERWGHWSPQLLIAAIAAVILLGLRPPSQAPALLLTSVLLIAFVIVTWLLMRQHDRHLCESCAASMPLNPAEVAARQTRRFWLVHRGNDPRYLVPYLVVLLGSNVLTSPTGRIIWALVQASMMYLIAATASHRKLQPWCPWCSEDGGGDLVPLSGPDSPRGGRRQLV
jgi:hypothetical protein